MPIPKSRHGGAYIMVLASTMLMLLIVVLALSVTALSRRVTAHYSYYIGLYDLAVSGNEQALFLLSQIASNDDIYINAWNRMLNSPDIPITLVHEAVGFSMDGPTAERFGQIFHEEIRAALGGVFARAGINGYRLVWGLDAAIEFDEITISDSYGATTNLLPGSNRFSVSTSIHRYIDDNTHSHAALVEAAIIWAATGYREIGLNANTIASLVYQGAISPYISVTEENMILFLDEFTFTMVESLRVAR